MKTITDKGTPDSRTKQFSEWPEIMTPEDLKHYCGFGHADAYATFSDPKFPLINPNAGRGKRVGKYALREWLNKGVQIGENSNQNKAGGMTQRQMVILVCESIIQALNQPESSHL